MLHPYEAKILTLLIKKHTYWNTTEIAKEAKISWNTAEKYLEEMHKRGWIERKGRAKLLWKAIINEGGKDETK